MNEYLPVKAPIYVKRTWCYRMQPNAYEIAGCKCGNQDTQWSEFEGHLWCEPCQLDFIPEHGGVFDGPIPIRAAMLLGLNFDRIIIATGEIEPFKLDD